MSEKKRVIAQGRREVEVGTVLLDNDKNNVNADKNFCFLFLVNNNYYFLIPKCRFTKGISLYLF